MKNKLLSILCLLTLLFPLKLRAQEPYAVLTGNNANEMTLIFYYDTNKGAYPAVMEIGPFSDYDECPWLANQQPITEVIFDASFADYTELTSTAYWFASLSTLNTITGIKNLKTDSVTDMTEMFSGCTNLTSLDLSRFNTSLVTDMMYMFAGCENLTTIYVGNGWNISNVKNGEGMFNGCFNLKGGAGTTFNQGNINETYARIDEGENYPGYLTYLEDLDARKEDLNMLIGDIYGQLMQIQTVLEEKDPNRAATELWETLIQLVDEDVLISLSLEEAQTAADLNNIENKIWDLNDRMSQLREEVENYGVAVVEPYAVLSDNNSVLTFYYDDQKAARNGMSVGPFSDSSLRGWNEASESITSAVFEASFADCMSLTSTAYLFYGCRNLASIIGLENLHTDNVTNMYGMFTFCSGLTSLDLSGFKTDNVTNMRYMFEDCSGLTSLDLSSFNTSNVTDMYSMFSGCYGLTSLDVSSFNTDNVTNMWCMFSGCYGLTSLDVSGFNTDNVINMYGMFSDCRGLTSLDVSGFKTDNVKNMEGMFSGCFGLTSLDVSGFKTDNVTVMRAMFSGCSKLSSIDVSGFNTSKVEDIGYMFRDCSSLTSLNLSNFITDNVIEMSSVFDGCSALTTINLSGFNTAKVTDMHQMFNECSSLTTLDLTNFNTAYVTTMFGMFDGCFSLASLDLSSFNTANVTAMHQMFEGCSALTTIIVSDGWTTIAVDDSENMFTGCYSLKGGRGTEYTQDHTDVSYAHIDGGVNNPGYFTSKDDIEGRRHELIERLNEIQQQIESITSVLQSKDPNQTATELWQTLHYLDEDAITIHSRIDDAQTGAELEDIEWMIEELEQRVVVLREEVENYGETNDPIAYGVFTNNMMKLTFYYDKEMGTHDEGIAIPWEQLLNSNEMNNARQTLAMIDFDPSFANLTTLTSIGYLFAGCMNLTSINGLEYLITDNMTDMREMFASCESLTELDLRSFNTSKVTMMWGMFQGCSHLKTIIVGPGWTTSALTDEGHEMFAGCTSLVGEKGTTYSDEHFDADYAHVDGGPNNPGYLTGVDEPIITEFEVDGIFYRVHDQGEHKVTVAHVMRAEEELYVPSEVEYARIHWIVTALGEMAFADLESVKVIEVPESIDSVSVNLFNHCRHLAAIIWTTNVPLTNAAIGQFNNPNLLLYITNTANAPASIANVIDLNTNSANKIVLSDAEAGGNDFYCPEPFMAKEISYTHSYDQATQIGTCQGWESIVVPFDVQTYTHETKGEIYPISTLLDEQIELDGDKPFWLYAFTSNDEFVEADRIRANTPYIISMPNDPAYWDDYILSGRVTFGAKDVEVYPTRNVMYVESPNRVFVPNYENVDYENPDMFLLNVGDAYDNHLPGSVFAGDRPARRARPFEAYFVASGNYPARYMDIFSSDVDAIREIPVDFKSKKGVYDLIGRKVNEDGMLSKGVYIIDGQKVIVK